MRQAHKVDKVQAGIVKYLRSIPGVSVFDTSGIGKGFPDLVVGYFHKGGHNILIELKTGKAEFTEDEEVFLSRWHGSWMVWRSIKHAEDFLRKESVIL